MRGGALPPALLCAALGLALAFAPRRAVAMGLALLALTALAAAFVQPPANWQDGIFIGLWISIALTAASVHLPKGLGFGIALALSANGGLWTGLVIAAAGSRWNLVQALPCSLLCIPAGWAVSRGWGIAIKVVSSWLIAVSILAASLTLVPTPGYKPDHMD